MGLFDRIPFMSRKADPPASPKVRAIAFLDSFITAASAPTKLKEFADAAYAANVSVFSCINERTSALGSLHWRIVKGEGAETEPVKAHPLMAVLKAPNSSMTWRDLVTYDEGFHLLTGESYLYAVSGGLPNQPARGPLVGLYVIPPDSIRPVAGETLGQVAAYRYGADDERNAVLYHPSRVMFRKTFNPTDISRGLSPLVPSWNAVSADNAAARWNISLLNNGGRIGGILVTEGTMSPDQRARLKAQLDGMRGSTNAGKVLVLEGDKTTWQATASTPTELDWLAGRKLSRLEICQAFQVPPELVGDNEHKTYSNYAEARKSFWTETILPAADRLEASLNSLLKPFLANGERLEYDRNSVDALQEDRAALWTRARESYTAGLLTANESRAMLGLEPAKDPLADERMVPAGLTPAAEAADPDEAVEPEAEDSPAQLPATEEEEDLEDGEDAAAEKALASLPLELKLLKGPSRDAVELWKAQDRRQAVHVKLTRPTIKRLLNGDLEAAEEAVRSAPDVAHAVAMAEAAVDARRGEWERALKRAFRRTGMDFAKATNRGLKADLAGLELKARKAGPVGEAAWEQAVNGYWAKVGATKVAAVTSYTKARIRNALRDGMAEGEGVYQMMGRIQGLKTMSAGRAERIARTEVLAAGNAGSLAAAGSFGVPMKKLWLTTLDDRTRGMDPKDPISHVDPDGQAVKLDEPFLVAGEQLQFPGDSSLGASAGNVVNCRCGLSYEVDQDALALMRGAE